MTNPTSGGGVGGTADVLIVEVRANTDEQSFRQAEQNAEKAAGGIKGHIGTAVAAMPAMAAAAAAAVGAAAVAGVAAVTNLAMQAEDNVRMFQTQLGASAEEAENLGRVAEQVFKNNFGANLTEAAEMVKNVRREFKDLADDDLLKVTNASAAIADTFEEDQAKVAQAIKSVMDSTGASVTEATDFIAAGFQRGLNGSEDFLDTINEYGPVFAKAKTTTGELFSLLETGAQNGVLGTDKIADAYKEFGLTIGDVNEGSAEAYKQLGLDQAKLVDQINSGKLTMNDAFELVTNKLKGVKGEAERTQIIAAIFGGAGEDLGRGLAQLDLTKTKVSDLGGAADSLNVKYSSIPQVFAGVWREVQVALLPVGKEILALANEHMPQIKAGIAQVVPVVAQFAVQVVQGFRQGRQVVGEFAPYAQQVFAVLRPVVASLGQAFSAAFTLVVTLWQNVLRPALAAIAPYVQTVFQGAAAAVKVAIDFITGVLKAVTALLKGDVPGALDILSRTFERAATAIGQAMLKGGEAVLGALRPLPGKLAALAGEAVQGLVNGIANGAGAIGQAARGLTGNLIAGIRDKLQIRSPSRVMQELGEFVGDGFVRGIASKNPAVAKAAKETASAFTDALGDLKLERSTGVLSLEAYVSTLKKAQAELREQLKGVKEGTPAYSAYLKALSDVNAQLDAATKKSPQVQAAAKKQAEAAKAAADELKRNREQIASREQLEAYTQGLRSASAAQLDKALAVARNRGEIERYNAIRAEQERRDQAGAAATRGAADAQREFNEALEQGVRDGNAALDSLDLSKMGGRDLAAQAQALPDVAANFRELTDRIIELRTEIDEPGVVDAWNESIEDMGRRGLITAAHVKYLKQQIADLQNIASEPLLPDNLQGRGIAEGTMLSPDDPATGYLSPAERDEYLQLAVQQDPAWLQKELAHLERLGKGQTDLAEVYREALATIESANLEALDSIRVGTDEAGNAIYATEQQLRGIGVAADDVGENLFDLSQIDVDQFSLADLVALATQAKLTDEQVQELTTRWWANNEALQALITGYDEAGNAIYLTDDALRGIGVTLDNVAEGFYDLSQIDVDAFGLDELVALATQAGLTDEAVQALTDRWWANNQALADLIVGYDEAGNAIYKTEDQIRGIGVASDEVTESFFDMGEAIKGVSRFSLAELEALIVQAGLTEDQANQLREAWNKARDAAREAQVKTINEWGNYARQLVPVLTGAMQAIGGASSEMAEQWGADMSSMVNDLVSFGSAVARGDWLGAAVQALSTIFSWFNRNAEAARKAAAATKSYNEQFKFALDGYGTRTTSSYTTGFWFWETTHYTEAIDQVKRDLALSAEGGFINGIKSGFDAALAANDFSLFEKSLKTSVGKAVLDGLIESFINQAVLAMIIGPAIDAYLANGDTAALQAAIRAASGQAEAFYNDVLKPIAEEFGLLGSGSGGSVSSGPADSGRITLSGQLPTASLASNNAMLRVAELFDASVLRFDQAVSRFATIHATPAVAAAPSTSLARDLIGGLRRY